MLEFLLVATCTGIEPVFFCVTGRRINHFTNRPYYGGSGEIRTHGTLRYAGFQDQSHQPLGHTSVFLAQEQGLEPWTFGFGDRRSTS